MAREGSTSGSSSIVMAARDALIEMMEQGVIVLDSDDRVLDMNPAAETIVGQSRQDAMGQPVTELLQGRAERLKETGEGQTEIKIVRRDREQVFEARLSPLEDRRGRPLGRVVILHDVSDRERLEQALRETRQAAKASDRAKSDFMSVASHEMRTPITSIKGYTDLLAKGTVGPVNETQADFLDIIRANVDRIALLVSDLSDIARIESGRLSLELGAVDVPDVVVDAVQGLQAQIDEKEQVLRVCVPDDLPPVRADHERVVQVLSNLISNAHKFTPRGGCITVRAGRGSAPGHRDDAGTSHDIVVAVEDNGIGIREHEQEKVFEKFYRSEDREASEMPGSGLGLSIAANLVEMQGGQIWLESVFRRGTAVKFTLPVAPSRSI